MAIYIVELFFHCIKVLAVSTKCLYRANVVKSEYIVWVVTDLSFNNDNTIVCDKNYGKINKS